MALGGFEGWLPLLVVAATLGMTTTGLRLVRTGRWPVGVVYALLAVGWVLGAAVFVRRLGMVVGLV